MKKNLVNGIIIVLTALVIGLSIKIYSDSTNRTDSTNITDDSHMKTDKTTTKSALEAIHSRKSVRSYTDQKVSRAQLDTLVRAAMAAPTAVNKQPWAFVVVDDRAVLDSLAEGLPYAKMLADASAAIIVCGDTEKALLEVDQAYWVQDCSAAAQNILLAAESMGLGTVWTGVFPRSERVAIVREILRLPDHIIPLNVIPVGYPVTSDEQPKDKYKPENVHFNGW